MQLKHCGKQVCELLLTLVKNLDLTPAEHLLNLMSQLEPSAHSEQVTDMMLVLILLLFVSAASVFSMNTVLMNLPRLRNDMLSGTLNSINSLTINSTLSLTDYSLQ